LRHLLREAAVAQTPYGNPKDQAQAPVDQFTEGRFRARFLKGPQQRLITLFTPRFNHVASSQLPDGNAQEGMVRFRRQGPAGCTHCHTLPSGVGPSAGVDRFAMDQLSPPAPAANIMKILN
jgi:hypothetical protein